METDSLSELMLTSGCTERQMRAVDSLLADVEKRAASVNMNVLGLRALAYCGHLSGKDADAVHWLFKQLLTEIRQQRDSLAGLIGKKRVERVDY